MKNNAEEKSPAGPEISIICPAYNDEENIGPLVERCFEALAPRFAALEIIIVDDGGSDGTGRAADALAERFREVRALHHPRNMGHGAALKTGVRAAAGRVIAFMDGDGQYEPRDLPDMVSLLAGADLVQGRRAEYPNGAARAAVSRLYNIIAGKMFGAPVGDLGCSIKVMKREAAEKAMPESDGIFAQGELVIRAHRAGFIIKEKDVRCYPRFHGRSSSMKPRNVVIMAREMMRLRRRLAGGAR